MYEPDVAILLMYGSYDMRYTGFCRLTVVNGTPGDRGVAIRELNGCALCILKRFKVC